MDEVLAIYPTARKVEQVLKEQSRAGARLGHRVLTFPQLVNYFANELPARLPLITPIGERMALSEALSRVKTRHSVQASTGLIAHMVRLIRELKSSALTHEDFHRSVRTLSDPPAGVLLLDESWSEYEEILRTAGAIDRRDLERLVLEFLLLCESGSRQPRFLKGVGKVLIAELYDFSLLEFMTAASLIRLVGDAELRIQADSKSIDAIGFADLTWNRFVDDESIADKVLPEFIRREGRTGRLGLVVKDIFHNRRVVEAAVEENVEIVEAADAKAEVEAVARAIRRNVEAPAAERIELSRIAILARDLTAYRDLIESVFRDHRIRIRVENVAPPASSPAALVVRRLLSAPIEGYQSADIDHLLVSTSLFPTARLFHEVVGESGYLNAATKELNACLADYVTDLRAQLREAKGKDDERAASRVRWQLDRSLRARKPLAAMMSKLAGFDREDSLSTHLARLEAAIDTWALESFTGQDSANNDHAIEWARSIGQVRRSLAEMGAATRLFRADRRLNLREFRNLVLDALVESDQAHINEASRGAVSVMAVEDARGLDFDLTFIIGLNHGAFPVYHGDDPILPDRIRIKLNRPLASALRSRFGSSTPFARILRTSNEHNSKDRFLFFLAISTATRRLKLSCASADDKGNPLSLSPFLDEVKALIGASNVHHVAAQQFSVSETGCFTRRDFLIQASVKGLLDSPIVAVAASAGQIESIRRRIAAEQRRRDYFAIPAREESDDPSVVLPKSGGEFDGLIGSSAALTAWLHGTGSETRSWSAGSIGELASCGFRFFAKRVLRLERRDERGHEMDAMERGSLIHDVLRELFVRIDDFSDLKRAIAAAQQVLAEYRRERAPRLANESFAEILWREIEATALEVVEFECSRHSQKDSDVHELLLEESFTMRLDPTPSETENFPAGITIRGKIDRLEIQREGGLVTRLGVFDYKNSRSARYDDLLKKEFGKTEFQLPVYLMAALERSVGQLSDAARFDAAYLVLKRHRNKFVARPIERAEIEIDPSLRGSGAAKGHKSAADRIFQIVASAAQGHFEVDPLKCDEFCAYREACRYRRPEDRAG